MAQAYWAERMSGTAEIFFRKLPPGRSLHHGRRAGRLSSSKRFDSTSRDLRYLAWPGPLPTSS